MKINNDVSTIVKPTEPKTVKTDVKQENAKIVNQNSDIVEISAEGKQKAKSFNNIYSDLEQLQAQLKSSNEQAESEVEANRYA